MNRGRWTVNFALLPLAWLAVAAPVDVRRDAVVRAVEKVMPAVVNISTETVVEVRDPFEQMLREFWGPYYRQRSPDVEYSLGSGVIIDEEGYLLTNDHVVRRASRVKVKLADGREFEAQPLAGTERTDLALLRIKVPKGTRVTPAHFAPDDDLLLGETVIALGNPFGLGGSVSRGILSSKARRAPREGERLDIANWLQTDASINPGNSGGPLINLRGELIGINVAVHRKGQGIGFAIPIKQVSAALSDFFTAERIRGLWMGARVRPDGARLKVSSVEADGPAVKGGLRVGDEVLAMNGASIADLLDWGKALAKANPGEVVLRVRRGGVARAFKLNLRAEQDFFNAALIRKRLGLSVQSLTQQLAERMGYGFFGGFVVTAVDEDGPARKAGLRKGYVLQALDGRSPGGIVDFARTIHAKTSGANARLRVVIEMRQGGFVRRRTVDVNLTVR